MDTSLPVGRRGQILAIAITFLMALTVWFAVVEPLIGLYQDRAEKLRQRQALALHMEALVDALPNLRQAAASDDGAPPPVLTIEGGSDAVAAATLQNAVQDIATSAGASLSSVEIVPAESVGGYRRVGIKLSLDAPWPVLVSLIKSIQQSSPPMLIDNLEMHASPLPREGAKQQLDTAFTVYAFRAATPAAASSAMKAPS